MAITTPSSGGPQRAMTIVEEPMMIPVAERGNLRAILRRSTTRRATSGMKMVAKRMQNTKSKM
jgi:hypothetical protein